MKKKLIRLNYRLLDSQQRYFNNKKEFVLDPEVLIKHMALCLIVTLIVADNYKKGFGA